MRSEKMLVADGRKSAIFCLYFLVILKFGGKFSLKEFEIVEKKVLFIKIHFLMSKLMENYQIFNFFYILNFILKFTIIIF